MPYNAAASSGSNLGPLSPALEEAVKARIARLKASDPTQAKPIPVDLVTPPRAGSTPTSARRRRSGRYLAWPERAA